MILLYHELKTLLNIMVKRILPPDVLRLLRRFRRKTARMRLVLRNKTLRKYTLSELRQQLQESGIDPHRDIFIHSAFSKIHTDCRAEDIIDLFIEYMDPKSNILMPAFPRASTMYEWMSDPRPFDVQRSPSAMGILTEIFRRRPDVHRSLHPTHTVCVRGPNSEYYVADHHKEPLAAGPLSPFARFHERNGQMVCIGVGVRNITANQVTNDTFKALPFETLLPGPMTKTVINHGVETQVATLVVNPLTSPWRIDNFMPKLREFGKHYRDNGCLCSVPFGNTDISILDLRKVIALQIKLAKKGITIYHRPEHSWIRKLSAFPY